MDRSEREKARAGLVGGPEDKLAVARARCRTGDHMWHGRLNGLVEVCAVCGRAQPRLASTPCEGGCSSSTIYREEIGHLAITAVVCPECRTIAKLDVTDSEGMRMQRAALQSAYWPGKA